MFKGFVKKETKALDSHIKALKNLEHSVWDLEDDTELGGSWQKALRSPLCPVRAGVKIATDFVQCRKRAFNMRQVRRVDCYANAFLSRSARKACLDVIRQSSKELASEDV